MKKTWLICFLCCVVFFNSSVAQTGVQNQDAFIKHLADSIYSKEKLPGIFIGILNHGERSFYQVGFADPDRQMPFDSATLFEIGSITKTFTAYILTAVLMENKIAETDRIIKYLPDSVQQNQNIGNISFLNLMNHTSGLPRLPGNLNMANMRQPYETYGANELFAYLKDCSPKPDGKSNYSNLGAGLAGVLAERISGKSYAVLADQYIFLPFNMVKQGNSNAFHKNKSQGYFAANDKAEYWNMNILAPAGGLTSTGNEMLTYLENMCFPKTERSKAIVNKLTVQIVSLSPKVAVGLGWHILNEKEQQPVYWHNGGTYGFSTFAAFVKDKSKAVIVVINQFNKNGAGDGLGISIIKKLISEE
jgi:CubicO group peptidase (beta-lactamase class C family)